jgi:hypothetical protein
MNLREHIRKVLKEEVNSADMKTVQTDLVNMMGKSDVKDGDRIKIVDKLISFGSSFRIIVDLLDQKTLDEIVNIVKKNGWFPIAIGLSDMDLHRFSNNFKDYIGEEDVEIEFEANESKGIDLTETKAFHVTPDIFINQIKQSGLTLKSESKLADHPNRIYLFLNDEKDTAKNMVGTLWNSLSVDRQKTIKKYYVLEIDLTKIPNHEFYVDPQTMVTYKAIYTTEPIPASAIKVIDEIDTSDLKTNSPQVKMSKDEEKRKRDEKRKEEEERIEQEKRDEASRVRLEKMKQQIAQLPPEALNKLLNIDVSNLEESIRRIVKEETQIPSQVLRRQHQIDEMFEHMRSRYTRLFCEYRNPNILLGVLYERTLSDLYHAWFYQTVSDDDWDVASEYIQKYLKNKYEKETIDFWEERCNNRDSLREEELTEKCWKGYTQKGMKTMFGKRYPNCVKKKK